MTLQTVWSLSDTASGGFEIAKGVLHAATSDNVQPLALISCEQFGNTIAMSLETMSKVEKFVLPTPQQIPIEFIKAFVGYSRYDSASQLGKTSAGVRFLGLAAALAPTMGPFKGAIALERMLAQSAADKTLLPTIRQLRDLLTALESRSHACCFADRVVGWHLLLYPSDSKDNPRHYRALSLRHNTPPPDGLTRIIEAFRQLHRVGEAHVSHITIDAGYCASWIAAFTTWCLGIPPSVYRSDGSPVLKHEGSQVEIFLPSVDQLANENIQVTIHYTIESPVALTVTAENTTWTGMVSIQSFWKLYLQENGLDSDLAQRAIIVAIPYSISEALRKINFSDHQKPEHQSLSDGEESDIDAGITMIDVEMTKLSVTPFQANHHILKLIALLLDQELRSLPTLPDGVRLLDLPVIKLFLQDIEKQCHCSGCSPQTRAVGWVKCEKKTFLSHIATLTASILALSLFWSFQDLQVQIRATIDNHGGNVLRDKIRDLLATGDDLNSHTSHLLGLATYLVGHDVDNEGWVISSFKGQVVYPTIFETRTIGKAGYLELTWLKGCLFYQDEVYSRVVGASKIVDESTSLSDGSGVQVEGLRNNFQGMKLAWTASVGEGLLRVMLGMVGPDQRTYMGIDPSRLLANLARVLFLKDCPHDRSSSLEKADGFCYYVGPFMRSTDGYDGTVALVAVADAPDLRFLCLSSLLMPAVLRGNSCLSCCLEVCRRANYSIVVL